MFSHIMVPIDLRMPPSVAKAMKVAAEQAKLHGAKISLVHVTMEQIREGKTDGKAGAQLQDLTDKLAAETGCEVEAVPVHSVDTVAEINGILSQTAAELGVDLVVMGTHMPSILDYVFSSHASHLVLHSDASVFVVR